MAFLIEKILQHLQAGVEETAHLIENLAVPYGEMARRLRQPSRYSRPRFKKDWAEWYRARKRFSNVLYHLRKDGLVKRRDAPNRRRSVWLITGKGRAKLRRLQERKADPFSRHHIKAYSKSHKHALVLVIFDIPERQERKRRWLREALRWLGFELLQKSVWLGREALPEEFLTDLRRLELIPYVHIFAVHKRGTLDRLGQ